MASRIQHEWNGENEIPVRPRVSRCLNAEMCLPEYPEVAALTVTVDHDFSRYVVVAVPQIPLGTELTIYRRGEPVLYDETQHMLFNADAVEMFTLRLLDRLSGG